MDRHLAPALLELRRLLADAAIKVQPSLSFALIGGLAVATWGAVRATADIDFLADSDPSPLQVPEIRDRLKKFVEKEGGLADWRVGGHDDPIPLLLRIELPDAYGVGADILWAHKRWQREALQRAPAVKVADAEIPVLHPEDLILMKLDAGGPQDLLDVQALLSCRPPELNIDRLKKKAARLRLGRALARSLREIG